MQVVETKNFNEQQKLEEERAKFKVKCKHCGHIMVLTFADRTICNHCGFYIYKDKQTEFRYKMKTEMRMKNDNRSTKAST